jgi:hypothetical protein
MTTHNLISAKSLPALSMPRILLHLEGIAILIAALVLYANQQFSWWAFALFLLAPDLPMLLYLINPRLGSITYNLVHTIIFPLALAIFSVFNGSDLGLQIALIWIAHIGMDRAFGYGFKYPGDFKQTHFSRI